MIKQVLKNPYIIVSIVFVALVAAVLYMLNKNDSSTELYVNSLLGVFTFFLTSLLVINAIKQNEISNRNIKLQLFDKRYKVFETIVGSHKMITEKDYSNLIISNLGGDPDFLNKKVLELTAKMHDAAILSQTLFDDELYQKISKAYQKYQELCDLHFKIVKQHIDLSENTEFKELFKMSLLAINDTERMKYIDDLNEKFPPFQSKNDHFISETAHYTEWIKESNILSDFDKYLKISELDNI